MTRLLAGCSGYKSVEGEEKHPVWFWGPPDPLFSEYWQAVSLEGGGGERK